MATLNDTQRILLSYAAQHKHCSMYPLPATLVGGTDRVGKAIAALIKRSFAEERETCDLAQICRTDGDIGYGVYATEGGIAALDIGDPLPVPDIAVPNEPRATKSSIVIALLQRDGGVTLAELIEATSWLPHTTRAALTGLRKKGYIVERSKRDDRTCYSIAA